MDCVAYRWIARRFVTAATFAKYQHISINKKQELNAINGSEKVGGRKGGEENGERWIGSEGRKGVRGERERGEREREKTVRGG